MANQTLSARNNVGVAQIVVPGTSSGLVSASGLTGNTTGSAIATGFVGETITINRLRSNGLTPGASPATGNICTTTSMTLGAGVWAITAIGGIKAGASTSGTDVAFAISKSSGALPAADTHAVPTAGELTLEFSDGTVLGGSSGDADYPVGTSIVVLSTSTTFYFVYSITYTSSTPTIYGSMTAVRIA